MAGIYVEGKTKASILKRFKKKDNKVFVDKAGPTLQKRAKKGNRLYYVIVDKKK